MTKEEFDRLVKAVRKADDLLNKHKSEYRNILIDHCRSLRSRQIVAVIHALLEEEE